MVRLFLPIWLQPSGEPRWATLPPRSDGGEHFRVCHHCLRRAAPAPPHPADKAAAGPKAKQDHVTSRTHGRRGGRKHPVPTGAACGGPVRCGSDQLTLPLNLRLPPRGELGTAAGPRGSRVPWVSDGLWTRGPLRLLPEGTLTPSGSADWSPRTGSGEGRLRPHEPPPARPPRVPPRGRWRQLGDGAGPPSPTTTAGEVMFVSPSRISGLGPCKMRGERPAASTHGSEVRVRPGAGGALGVASG